MKKFNYSILIVTFFSIIGKAYSQCFDNTLEPNYYKLLQLPTNSNPTIIVSGSINTDSYKDLVVNTNSGISIYLGGSNTNFSNGSTLLVSFIVRDIEINDIDGDGDNDIIVAIENMSNGFLRIFLNNGTGDFDGGTDFSMLGRPTDIEIADFDNDNKNDIIATNSLDANISVFRNISTNTQIAFTTSNLTIGFTSVSKLAIADFENDGKNDIILAGSGGTFIFTNNSSIGNINFDNPVSISNLNVMANDVAIADLNNDTYQDIILTEQSQAKVFLGNDLNQFTYSAAYPIAEYSNVVISEDFNNDNFKDIAAVSYIGQVSVLLNAGNALFNPTSYYSAGTYPTSIVANDTNGDTFKDLIVTNSQSENLSIMFNYGNGTFGKSSNFSGDAYSINVADFDSDNDKDVLTVNKNSYSFSIYKNASNGDFSNKSDFIYSSNPYIFYFIKKISDIEDFDGDGKKDVAIVNGTQNKVFVLKNSSHNLNISFDTSLEFTVSSAPKYIIHSDFDGDSKPDLATINSSSNDFSILINTSSSSSINFASAQNFNIATSFQNIASADLNSDGKPDIVVGGNGIKVFLNTTSGGVVSFNDIGNYSFSNGNVKLNDINNDGKIDIISTTETQNAKNIVIYLGNGDGTFNAPTNYLVTTSSMIVGQMIVELGNFNGDIFPDIIVSAENTLTNTNSNEYFILLNNGLGAFNTVALHKGEKSPTSLFVFDFNQDGKDDFVSSNASQGIISFQYNCANITPSISILPNTNQSICSSSTINLSNTASNFIPTSYSWSSSPAGFSSDIANPTLTAPNVSVITNYIITLSASNSTTTATATVRIVVNPLPLQQIINGGGTYCSYQSGVPIGLDGSEVGINYQLTKGNINIGTQILGTGSAINFGIFTESGTYGVVAINPGTNCIKTFTSTVSINISLVETPKAYERTICSGKNSIITSSGCVGTVKWFVNATTSNPIFIGNSYNTPNLTTNTTYWLLCENSDGCVSTRTSVNVLMQVCNAAPSLQHQVSIGGSNKDIGNNLMTNLSNTGYIIGGTTFSSDPHLPIKKGNSDILISLKDRNLKEIKSITLGGILNDSLCRISKTRDNLYYMVLSITETANLSYQVNITKLDIGLNVIWSYNYGRADIDIAHKCFEDTTGDFVIVGHSYEFRSTKIADYWVFKIDRDGNQIWEIKIGGNNFDKAFDIFENADGSYSTFGETNSDDQTFTSKTGFDSDIVFIKISKNGIPSQPKFYSKPQNQFHRNMMVLNNAIYTVGYENGTVPNTFSNFQVCKFDLAYNLLSQAPFSIASQTDAIEEVFAMELGNNNDIVVAGNIGKNYSLPYVNGYQGVILSFSQTIPFTMNWSTQLGGEKNEKFWGLYNDGGEILAIGEATSQNAQVNHNYGDKDIWVVKLSQLPTCNGVNYTIKSSDWVEPSSWSCGKVPILNEDVYIRKEHQIITSYDMGFLKCKNLEVEQGAVFVINPNFSASSFR